MPGTATPPRNAAVKTYDATDNGDGTFTIHDVEIVGPMPQGDKPDSEGRAPATDAAWMDRVVENHLAQLVSGYVAPVHAGHHNGIFENEPVGTFVPLGHRKAVYEGEEIDVLFGDVTVDAATLAGLREGRWPYRSIEVAKWDAAVIQSLAFLSGSAPYWRFPMLRDIRVRNAAASRVSLTEAALAAVTDAPRATGFRDVPARLRARELARLEAFDREDEGGDQREDSDRGDRRDESRSDATGEEAAPKWAAALQQGIARLLEAVLGKKTEDRVQPARDEDPNESGEQTAEDEESEDSDEDTKGRKAAKESAKMTANNATLDADTKATLAAMRTELDATKATLAAIQTENATLKSDLATAQRASDTKDFIATSKAKLRAKRVIVPNDFDAVVTRLYAAGKPLAEDHVATLEANGRQDPPERFTDEVGLNSTVDADAPEFTPIVQKSKNAPATLEACRKAAREFRAYKAACPGSALSLAEWLQFNVKESA